MKVAPHLHVEWVEDEAVVLDTRESRLHYLNSSAALVYALIEEHGYDNALLFLEEMAARQPDIKRDLPGLIEDMVDRGILLDG